MATFFKELIGSVTDFSFYRSIVRQKVSATLRYFLLLIFLASLIATSFLYFSVREVLENFAAWTQKNLPELEIRDGVVSSTAQQPYAVHPSPHFVFIVDSTGQTTHFEPQHPQGILVLKDRLLLKTGKGGTQDFPLNWVRNFKINAALIQKWKNKTMPFLAPFLFAVTLGGLLISKINLALFFAMTLWAFARPESTGLYFRDFFNLSVYAATPPVLLNLLIQALGVEIPYFGLICFALYGAFVGGAFWQCRIRPGREKNLLDGL